MLASVREKKKKQQWNWLFQMTIHLSIAISHVCCCWRTFPQIRFLHNNLLKCRPEQTSSEFTAGWNFQPRLHVHVITVIAAAAATRSNLVCASTSNRLTYNNHTLHYFHGRLASLCVHVRLLSILSIYIHDENMATSQGRIATWIGNRVKMYQFNKHAG